MKNECYNCSRKEWVRLYYTSQYKTQEQQEIENFIVKKMFFTSIVNSVPVTSRREVEIGCDIASTILDIANMHKTPIGRIVVAGAFVYTALKFVR